MQSIIRGAYRTSRPRIYTPAYRERKRKVRFFSEGDDFDSPAFIDDFLENPLHCAVIERPAVLFFHPIQNGMFPLEIVNFHPMFRFDPPDFDRAPRTFVQKLDNLPVDFINTDTPAVKFFHSRSSQKTEHGKWIHNGERE